MPKLGAALDFAQLEARNIRVHQLSAAPGAPVTGQLYYDTVANSLLWWNGSAWIGASGGTPPDATASTKGVVQLAGDLAGTAAAPVVAALAITDAKVAAANKDGAAGTFSMRSLGLGALQAMPGNERLDQITAPTASVSMNNQKLVSVLDPTGAQDGATKNYVDNVATGLDAKQSVRCATTTNLAALSGLLTVDGIVTIAGDRVLVKDQTTQSANGIYVVASGAWTRATDADTWGELPGAFTFIEVGTVNADAGWVCTVDQGGTLGTTNVTWTQFTGAYQISAGPGITKTGNQISANADGLSIDTAGAGTSLEVRAGGVTNAMLAGSIDVTTKITGAVPIANGGTSQTTAKAARETGLVAAGYYSNNATHGAGTTITITQATHLLRSSRAIQVQVQDNTTGAVEIPDIVVAANGDVTITYAVSVSANTKLVTLVG